MIERENIIPLAGMFQAAYQIHEIANTGTTNQRAFEASISSILKTKWATTEDVYGGIEGVKYGLDLIADLFSKENKPRDMEIARYVLGIVYLEKKLRKRPEIDKKLMAGIERATSQAEAFGNTHENVIASLADIYAETISTIEPKIMVAGDPTYLTNPHYSNKIRALLLALMRSTILWIQKDGSRWHLILQRKKVIEMAKEIRRTIPANI